MINNKYIILLLLLLLLLLHCNISNSFTLANIAQQYEEIQSIDYNTLIARGYPIRPRICLIDKDEQMLLYLLALNSPGSILEEGSYCGCSTLFLSAGARDENTFYDNVNSFITSDTFASGIQSGNSPMRYTLLDSNRVGMMVWNEYIFDFDADAYQGSFDMILNPDSFYKGSMLSCLYSQLYEQNLHDNVTIVAGLTKNIASMIDSHLIWSDAAHDEAEINRNSISWKRIAKKSLQKHNVIFYFHDVGVNEKLIELVNNIFNEYDIVARIILSAIYAIELSLKTHETQVDVN